MFEDYLFYTDEFLDAHQLDFKESTTLFGFEDKEDNEDIVKLFGSKKIFYPKFGF